MPPSPCAAALRHQHILGVRPIGRRAVAARSIRCAGGRRDRPFWAVLRAGGGRLGGRRDGAWRSSPAHARRLRRRPDGNSAHARFQPAKRLHADPTPRSAPRRRCRQEGRTRSSSTGRPPRSGASWRGSGRRRARARSRSRRTPSEAGPALEDHARLEVRTAADVARDRRTGGNGRGILQLPQSLGAAASACETRGNVRLPRLPPVAGGCLRGRAAGGRGGGDARARRSLIWRSDPRRAEPRLVAAAADPAGHCPPSARRPMLSPPRAGSGADCSRRWTGRRLRRLPRLCRAPPSAGSRVGNDGAWGCSGYGLCRAPAAEAPTA